MALQQQNFSFLLYVVHHKYKLISERFFGPPGVYACKTHDLAISTRRLDWVMGYGRTGKDPILSYLKVTR